MTRTKSRKTLRSTLFLALLLVFATAARAQAVAPSTTNSSATARSAAAQQAFDEARDASMAGDAAAALEAVQRAVRLAPGDVEVLRGCAEVANWNEHYDQAVECYRAILDRHPADHDASLGEARSIAWAGHTDHAVHLYRHHVERFPDDADARLELARTEAWRGNAAAAREVLRGYEQDFGDCAHCRRELAFVLARERPRESLRLLDDLMLEMPDDPLVRTTLPVALAGAGRPARALDSVDDLLGDVQPGTGDEVPGEIRDVARWVETPLRSRVTPLFELYDDSDSVRRERTGLEAALALGPNWRVDAAFVDTTLDADAGSGLAAVSGRELRLRNAWLGAEVRVAPWLQLDGRIGRAEPRSATLGAEDLDIWSVGAEIDVGDVLRLGLRHGREFYDVSPRALDLGIVRTETELRATARPSLRWTIDVDLRSADLSDGNDLRWWIVAPRRAMVRREDWNLDLGLRGRGQRFDLDLANGYYDPADYRRYDLTAYAYWKITDDHGLSIFLAAGPYRDDTATSRDWADHDWAGDVDLDLRLGLFDDWMLRLRAAHSINDRSRLSPGTGAFDATSFTLALTRRF